MTGQTQHLPERHRGAAVVVYAESNSPATTHATPNTATNIAWDTFYDIGFNDITGDIPDRVGLTYAAGVFTATETGIWIVNLGVGVVANPGSTGTLRLTAPSYGFSPTLALAAVANAPEWQVERIMVMVPSDTFRVYQDSTGSSVQQITYAALDIVRVSWSAE